MSLRKLTLSLLFAGLLLAIYAYTQNAGVGIVAGLLALLLTVVIAFEGFVRQPLLELTKAASSLARKGPEPAPRSQGSGEIGELAASLDAIRERLSEYDGELARASGEVRESRSLLRESEERYGLAVRGANDGLLEWDLKTDRSYFSPRWKSMLGFAEAEIGDRIDEWRDRIHPDDRARALEELKTHLDSGSPRFENEHRLRHKDGSWRWVLARGCALRNASGKAYRLLGLHTDITARKKIEGALLDIADGLAATSGEEAFSVLTRNFASVLGVREAIVCECMNFPTTRVRMLAYWVDGGFAQPREFDLAGTSCEQVIHDGKVIYFPKGVGERYPLEKRLNRDGYLGIPIFGSKGTVIGHIAYMHNEPLRDDLPHFAILKIFAARAALELERRLLASGMAPLKLSA